MDNKPSPYLAALIAEREDVQRDLEHAQIALEDADREAFETPTPKALRRRAEAVRKRDEFAAEWEEINERYAAAWAEEFAE
ncbi:MAG TPA: hypothetical protein VFB38_07110 [Chthonomonadaceae bacterium]|nr:hypothetical protein [Chthonomonadaceae bacterium]